MAVRTDRIEARVTPDRAARIRRAALLRHTSVSNFVIAAAANEAERVLLEHHETLVTSDYFDALLAALDEPAGTVPALRKAAAGARGTVTIR